ncbi:hypothetical protein GCM10017673_16870 [Streptosporangium violaceochromogenes]|nr:hypothetical protein GCM10017673_16870 [Streptosporangium violaceochromogenes]
MPNKENKPSNPTRRNWTPLAVVLAVLGGLFWLVPLWGLITFNALRPSIGRILHPGLAPADENRLLLHAAVLLAGTALLCFLGRVFLSMEGKGGKLFGTAVGLLLADLVFVGAGAYWMTSSLEIAP